MVNPVTDRPPAVSHAGSPPRQIRNFRARTWLKLKAGNDMTASLKAIDGNGDLPALMNELPPAPALRRGCCRSPRPSRRIAR